MRLQLANVTVDFGTLGIRALAEVDLKIDEGEQVALLGPSGSGKTTLLRTLVGAVRPCGGQIRVGGLNPFGSSGELCRLRRATGIVRQRDDLVLGLSGRMNAVMGTVPTWGLADWFAVLRGEVPARYADRLHRLCRRHGIEACLPARVEQLSGGQRQRVALVRALLPRPKLLLADEPTNGLDPPAAATAVEALRTGDAATLVLATHDLRIAERFPRVVALRHGRVVFDGPGLGSGDAERIFGAAGAAS
jgi:ABC-type phosphate/phosphonate transport system ATPase subunit